MRKLTINIFKNEVADIVTGTNLLDSYAIEVPHNIEGLNEFESVEDFEGLIDTCSELLEDKYKLLYVVSVETEWRKNDRGEETPILVYDTMDLVVYPVEDECDEDELKQLFSVMMTSSGLTKL